MRIPAAGEALEYARRLGFRRAFNRGAYVMVNQAFPLTVFDCVQLRPEDVNAALVEPADRYERRFLEPEEIGRVAGDLDEVSERVAREALTRGDACYAVLDGERLANLSCFAPGPTPLLNDLVVRFDPPCWYMYGAFTPPPYRGRRLHALGVLGGALELFDQGVPALVGVYERTNYASMVSTLRMGWRPCGRLYRIGFGSWTHHGRSAEAKAAGMRLEPRDVESLA